MEAPVGMLFYADEHLPVDEIEDIVVPRGHRLISVQIGLKDPAILVTAEQFGAVIITADKWFLRELFRFPRGYRRRFTRAGVVKVPGEWDAAKQRLIDYLPVVEAVYWLRQGQADHRLGVDFSEATIRIVEA